MNFNHSVTLYDSSVLDDKCVEDNVLFIFPLLSHKLPEETSYRAVGFLITNEKQF